MRYSDNGADVVWPIRDVRRFIAYVGIGFPLLLFFGSLILEGWPVPDSISGYYYSHSMHYVFMVSQIGLGALLIYYQYRDPARDGKTSVWDAALSTLAGLFAIGVGVFTPAPAAGIVTTLQGRLNVVHLTCAVSFFLSLAVIVLFFFTRPVGPFARFRIWLAQRRGRDAEAKALDEVWERRTPEKRRRNGVYEVCGSIMLISGAVMGGWLLFDLFHQGSSTPPLLIFAGETISIFAFGFAWLVKGERFLRDKGDAQEPANGHLGVAPRPDQPSPVPVARPAWQEPVLQDLLRKLPEKWAARHRGKWMEAWTAAVDLLVDEE
jgi:hypothetical protein